MERHHRGIRCLRNPSRRQTPSRGLHQHSRPEHVQRLERPGSGSRLGVVAVTVPDMASPSKCNRRSRPSPPPLGNLLLRRKPGQESAHNGCIGAGYRSRRASLQKLARIVPPPEPTTTSGPRSCLASDRTREPDTYVVARLPARRITGFNSRRPRAACLRPRHDLAILRDRRFRSALPDVRHPKLIEQGLSNRPRYRVDRQNGSDFAGRLPRRVQNAPRARRNARKLLPLSVHAVSATSIGDSWAGVAFRCNKCIARAKSSTSTTRARGRTTPTSRPAR